MGESEERAGRNEALFREVNENIAKLEERLGPDTFDPLQVVCECASKGCETKLEISYEEYSRVRDHHDHFVVARGHEDPSVERVLEEHRDYMIVQKEGEAEAAADAAS